MVVLWVKGLSAAICRLAQHACTDRCTTSQAELLETHKWPSKDAGIQVLSGFGAESVDTHWKACITCICDEEHSMITGLSQ
jgi:hypothetical protein